ncbi:protein MEMO1 [Biomphalaria glabrata]|uniref:Protein MEMO1-like n=1 Tax=Biomphalaria glabrata TaxID=6526 RepID=A0A2C9LFH2_BIOGL|nr:protein MEMO1-like [Biomphalaria glabrata]XP_013070777.1 protein MEMO1-like [Biomphalaria glabrata]XP_055880950.1 protein MEMO1-like [Biomphalaria glabrata]XP_055880951.1 protein MEMO1-like [Biomphalaria glabrata]XP_055880952.1 protein MEMO1-like [Biomphalaria glabrata]XP_055880953.1 protein MEMO1-like [Biomphalaria glabrata]XP_055880954.1 protein MEMO1-like [Biomphalaria glabrata]XP_055880955.1 protein MEMO1-like [Biomphalaria glabrata]XP_055880956.1 protein MEMO1-like [Biomphalaria gla
MSKNGKIRKASHAGSWYSESGNELNAQLGSWLSQATESSKPAKAIIAPHAGYFFCGACGAYAYRQVDPNAVKRVFILGPSHHVRMSKCALSGTDIYETPLYNLVIDKKVYEELYATSAFETMSISTDEAEHSIEMHLPYIAKVMESRRGQFTIVPILVGSLSPEMEMKYGQILSSYLKEPGNLFVISSDFCHWGKRFSYTYYEKSHGKIWQSIEALDRMGMDIIEKMDPSNFTKYLQTFQNTICGRHPIGILLNAIDKLKQSTNSNGLKMELKFLKYDQSSKCESPNDSSVSYASAALVLQ